MNARSLKSIIGSGLAGAVVLGVLAALPAQAGSGLIKITHSSTSPYRSTVQAAPATATTAKAQPAATQAAPAEVQVAVMATSPAKPAVRRSVFIHR
jgi:hypothetical protein